MKQVEPKPELPEELNPPKGNGMTEKEAVLTKENEELKKSILELRAIMKDNEALIRAFQTMVTNGYKFLRE